MRSSKEESASCEEMALRNGILNKNVLIGPLKESIIKAITLPPQDHVSGRVMAFSLAKERRHYASGRVILTKTIFVDVERRISKRRSPISRICPCEGMLGWWHKM